VVNVFAYERIRITMASPTLTQRWYVSAIASVVQL